MKIMIGGAPITDKFCETIGADAYTPTPPPPPPELWELLA